MNNVKHIAHILPTKMKMLFCSLAIGRSNHLIVTPKNQIQV